MTRPTYAQLLARIEALESTPARAPRAKSAVRTFASKAERAAGDGFACSAEEPCSRKDLRTSKRATSHDPAIGHFAR